MELGVVIKTARLGRHWTQQELAVRLGLARPTISNWERGRHYPRLICLRALERVLKMRLMDR